MIAKPKVPSLPLCVWSVLRRVISGTISERVFQWRSHVTKASRVAFAIVVTIRSNRLQECPRRFFSTAQVGHDDWNSKWINSYRVSRGFRNNSHCRMLREKALTFSPRFFHASFSLFSVPFNTHISYFFTVLSAMVPKYLRKRFLHPHISRQQGTEIPRIEGRRTWHCMSVITSLVRHFSENLVKYLPSLTSDFHFNFAEKNLSGVSQISH